MSVLNKLKVSLNKEELDKQYDVFSISTSEDYIKYGSCIFDVASLDNRVVSVCFDRGNKLFLMLEKSANNYAVIREVIDETKDDTLTFTQVGFSELLPNTIYGLLLNSLGRYPSGKYKFNNITGKLLVIHPKHIESSKTSGFIKKIHCLEISVNRDMCLFLRVKTFTTVKYRSFMNFGKSKFEDYPQYTFSTGNTLKRKMDRTGDDGFINHQTDNDKYEMSFLDIENKDKFEASKIGILHSILTKFNARFNGVASLEFEEVPDLAKISESRSFYNKQRAKIPNYLQGKNFSVIDKVGTNDSRRTCELICETLRDVYKINASVSDEVCDDDFNIIMIHEPKYYQSPNCEEDDPHKIDYGDMLIQHVTIEKFSGNSPSALRTLLNELCVKEDVVNQNITLFDWQSLGFDKDITFGMKVETFGEEESHTFKFMTIRPDGSFVIEFITNDMFDINGYTFICEMFEDDMSIEGIVIYGEKDFTFIKKTDYFTIPDMDNIYAELSSGNTSLRNKTSRDTNLDGVVDIKLFNTDKGICYLANDIGDGMRPTVKRAANVRLLEGGNKALCDKLIEMLNVTFVRNGQLTVLPFPFKYLREAKQ